MRFSLKWALAATTFAALACWAVAGRDWIATGALWGFTALTISFALRACFAENSRHGPAFGFILGSAIYFALACSVPTIVPPFQNPNAASGVVFYRLAAFTWSNFLSHANAIGVMVAGVLGAVLGAVAFRQGRRD